MTKKKDCFYYESEATKTELYLNSLYGEDIWHTSQFGLARNAIIKWLIENYGTADDLTIFAKLEPYGQCLACRPESLTDAVMRRAIREAHFYVDYTLHKIIAACETEGDEDDRDTIQGCSDCRP